MTIEQIAPMIIPVSTAITTIVAILVPIFRVKRETKKRLDLIEMSVMQLMLHDAYIPETERLRAGKRYHDLGGNGASIIYYKKLESRYQKRIEAIIEGATHGEEN